jgi:hypothetical protein
MSPDKAILTKSMRAAAAASRGLAAWTNQTLAAYRANPAVRERASALTAFGFIFAFGLMSLDYVVTGGPDWNPGASAAPLEHVQVQPQMLSAAGYEAPPSLPELELVAFEPEGPVGELLGGPDTRLPNEPAQFILADFSVTDVVEPTPIAPTSATARKLKAGGA